MNSDWYYIIGVGVAFVAFIIWNRSKNNNMRNRGRKSFKQRLHERKKEQ